MLYIIGHDPYPIKVGYTRDRNTFEIRKVSLQTGYPMDLIVYFFGDGSRGDEQRMHSLLQPYSLRGEWFSWSSEIRDLIFLLTKEGATEVLQRFEQSRERIRGVGSPGPTESTNKHEVRRRYSVKEAQEIMSLKNTAFWGRVKEGLLRVHQDGGRTFVSAAEMGRYLDACEQGVKR